MTTTLPDEGRPWQYVNVLIEAYRVGFNSAPWCGQSLPVIGGQTSLAGMPHQHVWHQKKSRWFQPSIEPN